jgi:hypothetical protein
VHVLQSPEPAPVMPRPAVVRPAVARTQSVPPSQAERKVIRRPQSAAPNGVAARSSRPATPKAVAVPGVDPKLVELIENDIVDRSPSVKWDDIGITLPSI